MLRGIRLHSAAFRRFVFSVLSGIALVLCPHSESLSETERLSVSAIGVESNGFTFSSSASKDGRFIVFESYATNLVVGTTSLTRHVYLKDRLSGEVTLVTKAPDGVAGNGPSFNARISGDGNFIVFDSFASNLVTQDTNGMRDIFLYDRERATMQRISLGVSGQQTNQDSWEPDVADGGALVVFSSFATNVVTGDTNTYRDIFLYNRADSSTVRINLANDGSETKSGRSRQPRISANGTAIVFVSEANNLPGDSGSGPDVFLYNVTNKTLRCISQSSGVASFPSLSDNGRYAVWVTQREASPPFSSPQIILFDSLAPSSPRKRIDVNSRGVAASKTSLVPTISRTGRYAGFASYAPELSSLVGEKVGLFVFDTVRGASGLVDIAPGTVLEGEVLDMSFLNDDAELAFVSDSTQLVAGDTNARPDVFTTQLNIDFCPSDPQKVEPGICGCGAADIDSDNDGAADCVDKCAQDPAKISPGACGCGVPDTDTDKDGTADCVDQCAQDPAKISPGVCGCGAADIDSDGDRTLDCKDGCPSDRRKTNPGICGCGTADWDSDSDGTADCLDGCPADQNKVAPGVCGCSISDWDADRDGTPDCIDECPYSLIKTKPGVCGCWEHDDANGDGVIDCIPPTKTPTPTPTPTPIRRDPLPPGDPTATPTPTNKPIDLADDEPIFSEGPTPTPASDAIEKDLTTRAQKLSSPLGRVGARFVRLILGSDWKHTGVTAQLWRRNTRIARKTVKRNQVIFPRPPAGRYKISYSVRLYKSVIGTGFVTGVLPIRVPTGRLRGGYQSLR